MDINNIRPSAAGAIISMLSIPFTVSLFVFILFTDFFIHTELSKLIIIILGVSFSIFMISAFIFTLNLENDPNEVDTNMRITASISGLFTGVGISICTIVSYYTNLNSTWCIIILAAWIITFAVIMGKSNEKK